MHRDINTLPCCTYILNFVQVDSLTKALSFSQHENLTLKAQIAKVT